MYQTLQSLNTLNPTATWRERARALARARERVGLGLEALDIWVLGFLVLS